MLAALALLAGLAAFWTDRRADRREAVRLAEWPPEGRVIEVDGTAIHAYIRGAGPDLVLLHGAGGNGRDMVLALGDRLSDRYRVIAFDRPGLGHSGWSGAGAASPREQARLMQRAAAELGITRPVVAGHSYGGAVAMAWALEAPDDTAALVVIAGATMPWPGKLDSFYRVLGTAPGRHILIPLISAFLPRDRLERAVAGIFAPQEPPPGYAAQIGAPLSIRRAAMRQNVAQVQALRPHVVEMSAHYATLRLPVEILHGTADTTVGLGIHAEPLSERLPDARLTVLEGIGHMPHHAATDAVAEAIDRAATRAGLRSGE